MPTATTRGIPAPTAAAAQPSRAEFLSMLNAQLSADAPARFADATLEAVGPPEPGSGRQAFGYRAILEIAEPLYVPAVHEPVFAAEKFDLPRWEAARRVLKSDLRAGAVKAAGLEEATPTEGPGDLILLRQVAPKGQRHTLWGRATVLHQVDRWALLERETSRVEPPLREGADPRAAFVAQHRANEIFLEDDRAGLRRWAEGWNTFASRVEAALSAQRAADATLVARYQADPAAYLATHCWILGGASWERTTGRYRVSATAEPAAFQAGGKVTFSHMRYDWRQEANGTVFIKHPDAYRGLCFSAVQVVDDEQGERLALVEPLAANAPGTDTLALVEAAR